MRLSLYQKLFLTALLDEMMEAMNEGKERVSFSLHEITAKVKEGIFRIEGYAEQCVDERTLTLTDSARASFSRARKTLEQHGLIVRETLPFSGRQTVLVSLTPEGTLKAAELIYGKDVVSTLTLNHAELEQARKERET